MSWATITKKTVPVQHIKKNPGKNMIREDEFIDNDLFDKIDINKIYKKEKLFNDLLSIKENSEQYSPWLLSKASVYDILKFINNYIDFDDTNKISDYESDNSDIVTDL